MERICCIFGAGEYEGNEFTRVPDGAYIIAADAGYARLCASGVKPDLVVGDFDSLDAPPTGIPVVRHPVEKDDTDMLLAVREGFSRGFSHFYLFGGMGGRLDHTLANLQCLIYLKQCSAVGYLMDDKTTAFVMQNETVWFKPEAKGFLSLFSLGEKASGVTIRNLKYEMQDGEITNSFPIGISNEFIGKRSSVTVEQGMLAVILSEKE